MRIAYAERLLDSLEDSPPAVKKAFFKQLRFLADDLRHSSLQAKKYDESGDIWQARVNRDWRFYFKIEEDAYRILKVMPHPK